MRFLICHAHIGSSLRYDGLYAFVKDVIYDVGCFQLYEDDARIGHQEFDLKLTNRVKMCMVSLHILKLHIILLLRIAIGGCSRDVV